MRALIYNLSARLRLTSLVALGVVSFAIDARAAAVGPVRQQNRVVAYAVLKTAEFIDHADDRIRGMSENPFTPNVQKLVIHVGLTEVKDGPYPGDDVLYTYQLYATPSLRTTIGAASYTCYYLFEKNASCDAYYKLKAGTVLGSGQIVFNSRHYTLSVVGGTSGYLAMKGALSATPAKGSERLAFILTPSPRPSGAAPGGSSKSVRVYSVANGVQYVNNADDEARGLRNNPFSNTEKKLKPTDVFKGTGPFPGDVLVFSFKLYRDAALKHGSGSAQLSCYYSYNLEAFCEAYYQFGPNGSTLSASGPIDFSTHAAVTLVVSGGTGSYLGASGEMVEAPTTQNAQRIDFTLGRE